MDYRINRKLHEQNSTGSKKIHQLTGVDGSTPCSVCIGYAYYGEYPLAFAACFGYEDIYDYLIDFGADPNCQDSYGNNVLHMIVIANRTV